jgi:dCMP deaminase
MVFDDEPAPRRPTRDEWLMAVARDTARRSTCRRRRYGAVIATPRGEIIATGYNGAAAGEPHCTECGVCFREALGIPPGESYELCVAVHAEQNATRQAGRASEGCAIYLYGEDARTGVQIRAMPCLLCARLLVNAGIVEVVTSRAGSAGGFDRYHPTSILAQVTGDRIRTERRKRGISS